LFCEFLLPERNGVWQVRPKMVQEASRGITASWIECCQTVWGEAPKVDVKHLVLFIKTIGAEARQVGKVSGDSLFELSHPVPWVARLVCAYKWDCGALRVRDVFIDSEGACPARARTEKVWMVTIKRRTSDRGDLVFSSFRNLSETISGRYSAGRPKRKSKIVSGSLSEWPVWSKDEKQCLF